MATSEILGILGYVVAYLAVGIGLSPLAVRIDLDLTVSARGNDPPPRPDPRVIGFFVLAWWVPVGIWALSRAWAAAFGLVTGLGRLACWLSGAEGERAEGERAEGEVR